MDAGAIQQLAGSQKDYGATFGPGKRKRMNILAIFVNIFVPWLGFCSVSACLMFDMHYKKKTMAWGVAFAGIALALLIGLLGRQAKQRQRDPMWYTFCALALFFACCVAAVWGDMNYWIHMHNFYDIENLNAYPMINPSEEMGQQVMDAGRVYFTDGTHLDHTKGLGFRNLDMYCVVPIVHGDEQPKSYDYWAVGMNCCSGVASDFRCGEYNNPKARSGLRLMRDDWRPFFRLAVQEAEAAYGIKAVHPLFFYWMQDPVAEVNSYREAGYRMYMLGMYVHFFFNLACVGFCTAGFSKLGQN